VPTAETRATDDDRNTTCQILDAALGDGQLSMEEHRERVSAATKAITLGDLQSLVSDLQIRSAPALRTMKSPARSRGIWIAAAVVVLLLVAGIGWGLHGSGSPSQNTTGTATSSRGAAASATPGGATTTPLPPPDLLSLGQRVKAK
jgi:hypothetical protein